MKAKWKILKGALLIDGAGNPPLEDAEILVEGTTIRDLGPAVALSLANNQDAEEYDFSASCMLPGLIDAHVHLVCDAGSEPLKTLQAEQDELLLLRASKNAMSALWSGITAVRDCGDRSYLTLVLRDAIDRGLLEGPRLVSCGPPITVTGGHCFFLGNEADGVEEVRKAARRLINRGVDFVKIMVTGGGSTPTTEVARAYYSVPEIEAAVLEARRAGMKVSAHCHGTEGIENAVRAGVDTIEHASFFSRAGQVEWDPGVADALRSQGAYVLPTLASAHRVAQKYRRENLPITLTRRLFSDEESKLDIVRRLLETGVPVVAGTDAGAAAETPFDDVILDLELLVRCGMSPLAAISAATKTAAEALALGDTIGSIEVGKEADILVVDGDPSKNLADLRRTVAVFKGGEKVV